MRAGRDGGVFCGLKGAAAAGFVEAGNECWPLRLLRSDMMLPAKNRWLDQWQRLVATSLLAAPTARVFSPGALPLDAPTAEGVCSYMPRPVLFMFADVLFVFGVLWHRRQRITTIIV